MEVRLRNFDSKRFFQLKCIVVSCSVDEVGATLLEVLISTIIHVFHYSCFHKKSSAEHDRENDEEPWP